MLSAEPSGLSEETLVFSWVVIFVFVDVLMDKVSTLASVSAVLSFVIYLILAQNLWLWIETAHFQNHF